MSAGVIIGSLFTGGLSGWALAIRDKATSCLGRTKDMLGVAGAVGSVATLVLGACSPPDDTSSLNASEIQNWTSCGLTADEFYTPTLATFLATGCVAGTALVCACRLKVGYIDVDTSDWHRI